MKFKKPLLLVLHMGFALYCGAQTITEARFEISDHSKGIKSIELVLDDATLVGISGDGEIQYVESGRERNANYNTAPDLNRRGYDGTMTIGNLTIKYYTDFDIHDPKGKIKSIGNIQIKYNNGFNIHDEYGTFKSIGDIPITYYNDFDIHDPKGKVKSIGNVKITYFNAFNSGDDFGRIKSIEGNTRELSVMPGDRNPRKN